MIHIFRLAGDQRSIHRGGAENAEVSQRGQGNDGEEEKSFSSSSLRNLTVLCASAVKGVL
jgi:hypothetical protein